MQLYVYDTRENRRNRWFDSASTKLEKIAGVGARIVGFESLQTLDAWYAYFVFHF
jgi:hypothetical protein